MLVFSIVTVLVSSTLFIRSWTASVLWTRPAPAISAAASRLARFPEIFNQVKICHLPLCWWWKITSHGCETWSGSVTCDGIFHDSWISWSTVKNDHYLGWCHEHHGRLDPRGQYLALPSLCLSPLFSFASSLPWFPAISIVIKGVPLTKKTAQLKFILIFFVKRQWPEESISAEKPRRSFDLYPEINFWSLINTGSYGNFS